MLFPLGSESPTELPFSEVFGNPEGPLCGHELSCSFWWLEGCSPSYPGSCHLGGRQSQCPMPEAGKIRMLSLSLAGGQPWNCFPRKEGERNRPRAGDWRTRGAKTSHFPGHMNPAGGAGHGQMNQGPLLSQHGFWAAPSLGEVLPGDPVVLPCVRPPGPLEGQASRDLPQSFSGPSANHWIQMNL